MSTASYPCIIFILAIISVRIGKCVDLDETMLKLREEMRDIKSSSIVRNSEDTSLIWEEYEFDTGAGNREELVVTDISMRKDPALSNKTENFFPRRHFLRVDGIGYLTESTGGNLTIYKLNDNSGFTESHENLQIDGEILAWKIVDSTTLETEKTNRKPSIVAALCVESKYGISLRWYEFSGRNFQQFWHWPVNKRVRQLEIIRHDERNRLVLLAEAQNYLDKVYSPIEIYDLIVDFKNRHFDFWVYERIFVPETNNIGACPIYDSTVLAVQTENNILLYDFVDGDARNSVFEELQNISSSNVKNLVCFESGYMQYLAISGLEAGLYHFFEKEFLFDAESEHFFNNFAEIAWVQDLRVETYRDESLLLIQLKNLSVIALSWWGTGFKIVSLPNKIIDEFDLSRITVIPKYGFVSGNIFVRIETRLRDVAHPVHDKMERLLKTKILLQEVFQKQEAIFRETEVRLNRSYLHEPLVTGFWNLSNVEAINVTISDDVYYSMASIGSNILSHQDFNPNVDTSIEKLKNLDEKLAHIRRNIQNAVNPNSEKINLTGDMNIFGGFQITGKLNVKNLTIQSLNGVDMSEIRNKYTTKDNETIINGRKFFPSLNPQNVTFATLNGIPVSDIIFDTEKKNYSDIDFSKIQKLVVVGHLNVSTLNGINWSDLMGRIVWKNKPTLIPGNTIVEGEITADTGKLDFLNGIEYPRDYVLRSDSSFAEIIGEKSFENLTIGYPLGIEYINDVPISDYVLLNEDQTLEEEITFENLRIDGNCEVNGIISGVKLNYSSPEETLIESKTIKSDVIVSNLTVLGNIWLENSINGSSWADFDDLLQRTDKIVEITGHKTFLNDVQINTPLNIKSNKINGHYLDEFVTLDTEQEFPNLKRISANVTFGKITDHRVKGLKDYLKENVNEDGSVQCPKKIIFETTPIIDDLFFNVLNDNISGEYVLKKFNETFHEVYFENLTVTTLLARKIVPQNVNGVNFTDFENRRITLTTEQNLTGTITIGQLETDVLHAKTINEMPLDYLSSWKDQIEALYTGIFSGAVPLENLTVTGNVKAKSINKKPLETIFQSELPVDFEFDEDIYVKNLTVLGLINNINFSELASDVILKTDTDIVVTGHKTFDSINCVHLEISNLNGHSVKNILDPEKEQIFIEPVTVEGSVNIEEKFEMDGKINDILFADLQNRFKPIGNNVFELHGDFIFVNDISVKNLHLNGSIGEIEDLDEFLKSIVLKNDDNITLSGAKIFTNSVTFDGNLVIDEQLNDINLKRFYEKAVRINESFSINSSKIIFLEEVVLEKNLTVDSEFEAQTLAGVDFNELENNILYTNRPQYIMEPIILENAIVESDVTIGKWNKIDMNLLIPLKTDQLIPVDVLVCQNVSVKNYEFHGTVNGYKLDAIYKDTFLLTDEQRITGNITFHGHVKFRHNFDARSINGIDPKEIVLANDNETMIGNFIFEKPVTVNGSVRVLQYLNGIDLVRWENLAVMTAFRSKQIIHGNWTVHGDVHFMGNILGDGFLQGVKIKKLADTLKIKNLEIEHIIEDTKADQNSFCDDLNALQYFAENQIYRYKTFEYLQIVDFDKNITGLHYFESDDLDYLLISYETCHMGVFIYDGRKFELVATIDDFGLVDKWITLKHQNEMYFLALGKPACGRTAGNLWKIQDDQFQHVADFGNINDARKISDSTFLIVNDQKMEKRSINESNEEFQTQPVEENHLRFVRNSNRVLLIGQDRIYEYDEEDLRSSSWENQFGSTEVFALKAGPFRKEIFITYGRNVTTDYIFIFGSDISRKQVLQTIKTHNPKDFLALNIENQVETLLVFAENGRYLQIYEYKGIQGFVHRDSIQINVDTLYNFQIRKHTNLAKRHCVAVVQKNRLSILEVKMHGEKLDMDTSSCPVH